ncbi:unnamed protein product [Rhizophagus irregularis]|nr:unnamed protein product [Rhizophagus irregularis]
MEKPSFDRMFRRTGKFQDSIWWASKEWKTKKPRFVRSGGLPKNENPKIRSGGLPKNENPKIKIRSGGFCLSKEWKKLKIRGLSKNNGKPRFVSLVSRVGSDKQKKTKDSFGGFPKDQDS